MKEKFIQFLKDNGALEKFEANLKISNWQGSKYKNISHLIKSHAISNIIDKAFVWSCTDEGFIFWDHLDNKWRDLCKSN